MRLSVRSSLSASVGSRVATCGVMESCLIRIQTEKLKRYHYPALLAHAMKPFQGFVLDGKPHTQGGASLTPGFDMQPLAGLVEGRLSPDSLHETRLQDRFGVRRACMQ
jgi:hypothetical protein